MKGNTATNIQIYFILNCNGTTVSTNCASMLLPMAILRVYCKYLDDGGGVPHAAQGCWFDELVRKPALLKSFFYEQVCSLQHHTAHIPLVGSAMLSDSNEIDGEDAKNQTAEAPQSI